jgi:hypothetical protein
MMKENDFTTFCQASRAIGNLFLNNLLSIIVNRELLFAPVFISTRVWIGGWNAPFIFVGRLFILCSA